MGHLHDNVFDRNIQGKLKAGKVSAISKYELRYDILNLDKTGYPLVKFSMFKSPLLFNPRMYT